MNIKCNNCGSSTHITSKCRNPVTSYCIILFKKIENEYKILMINRKDSLCYIDFLRGKYSSIYNLDYLKLLFSRMSSTEIERICNNDFDTLWNDLWIHTETINYRIKKEYIKR